MSKNILSMESPLSAIYQRSTQDPEFRQRLLRDPRNTLEQEMGLLLPEQMNITVTENTHSEYTIVLPVIEELQEEELEMMSAAGYAYHDAYFTYQTANFKAAGGVARNELGFGANPYS